MAYGRPTVSSVPTDPYLKCDTMSSCAASCAGANTGATASASAIVAADQNNR